MNNLNHKALATSVAIYVNLPSWLASIVSHIVEPVGIQAICLTIRHFLKFETKAISIVQQVREVQLIEG